MNLSVENTKKSPGFTLYRILACSAISLYGHHAEFPDVRAHIVRSRNADASNSGITVISMENRDHILAIIENFR